MFKVNSEYTSIFEHVTFNIFHTLFQCFYCYICASKCRLGMHLPTLGETVKISESSI